MRIRQLYESQKSQIERLHPATQVLLYYPTDFRSVSAILRGDNEREEKAFVAPDIRTAAKFGRIVLGFYSQGKELSPPPSMANRKTHEEAKQKFPDSMLPLVSLSLTSEIWPHAFYHGRMNIGHNIVAFYLVGYNKQTGELDGDKISTFTSTEDFLKVLINLASEHKRKRGGDQDWKSQKHNRSGRLRTN